ncbi:MAG: S9 family peptidase [Gammaproteobacteria bacterium]|nr:S9 family peptidase [Gammaproteobacteria bacterium]
MSDFWLRLHQRAIGALFAASFLCTQGIAAADGSLSARGVAAPPIAMVKPHAVDSANGSRVDNYYWLRDDSRKNPDVLAYLNAENAYADAMLAHIAPLKARIYDEIIGRIKQDDSSVPYRDNGWWYYSRFETGQEYPFYARREQSLAAPEQVLLDVPKLAVGKEFYHVASREVAPDNRLLAYTEDTTGRRQHTLRFKSLVDGRLLADRIDNVEPELAWTADSRAVFYIEKDPVTLLGLEVRRHDLGTDPKSDPVVYEQDDPSFYTYVYKTSDRRYIVIYAESTVASEMRIADAASAGQPFQLFLPRERDHEYRADHLDGRWIIRTNWNARNFRLMEAKDGNESDRAKWQELLPHRDDAFVGDFAVFKHFVAVGERSGGLGKIRIRPWSGGKDSFIAADDPTYTFSLGANHEVDTDLVRYTYESLATPPSTFDFNARTGERTLLKREAVLGKFDPAEYATEFLWATARDGTKVPVSLVYRRGVKRDGTAPLLQYAYGSYGSSTDPWFQLEALSLLDRGFVFAIAHVRGGQELGRGWYEDGKLLNKQNTFSDFVDVTRFLVKERYADPKRVFANGVSAGGLLMGAIANQAPRDYRGIIAEVPFVDAVTTMLDTSIPLTTNEFDEWGNPAQKAYYDCILAYSPYDNVSRQDYPAMLVTASLRDSQVQYYEPAKWVARLRALKTDSRPLLLRTSMAAGHGGKSGRYQQYADIAEIHAFILDQAGIRD